ncbi:hypothetical protein [Rheinheimera tangshanensis]|uniref:Uncharacterized protein n=1 Tax=Rheinheimera tangshanensis TaxID=400153 RepID=A0A5C8LN62_9GAMM|nr:hypothetical protein [Rheinheimera tangshanensis]TXK77393.1 hypothetical protein FU839_18460 [Rheinheimera tangshanensis]GGM72325.1 hypothetical protein GCM10010920_36340 [Rheinheimera tangshanensis]
MSYSVKIIDNNLIPLPDDLCAELSFSVGDILLCELDKDRSEMRMVKYTNQTLTDEQISAAGNLTRVIKIGSSIKNEQEHQAALEAIEQLLESEPGTRQGAEFERLARMIEEYEDIHYPLKE